MYESFSKAIADIMNIVGSNKAFRQAFTEHALNHASCGSFLFYEHDKPLASVPEVKAALARWSSLPDGDYRFSALAANNALTVARNGKFLTGKLLVAEKALLNEQHQLFFELKNDLEFHVMKLCFDIEMKQDLRSAANIGALFAIERFDTDKGYKLTTYARAWIRKYILAEISGNYCGVGSVREQVDSDKDSRTSLATVPYEPWMESISSALRMEDNRLDPVVANKLVGLVSVLPSRYRDLLLDHFGLISGQPMSKRAVAEKNGLSPNTAADTIRVGLKWLQAELEKAGYADIDDFFVDDVVNG